jgi:uncharacterized protein YrrD
MLDKLTQLQGRHVTATDGDIGHVVTALFDDESWIIRYLVVASQGWFSRHEVLISPYAVVHPVQTDRHLHVALTRQKVKDSPDIDTRQSVSRQHELAHVDYYNYPPYWEGVGFWGVGAYPVLPMDWPTPEEIATDKAVQQHNLDAADTHLRSGATVAGYDIQATDGSIGHIQDFIYDDASWAVRYLVVDTRNWWPGGKKVLIATHWIDEVSWETQMVLVNLTREEVRHSPEYDEDVPLSREYETRLHSAYKRASYWDGGV